MTGRWASTFVFLLGCVGAAPAWSCSYFAPTYAESLDFQQGLWRDADAVFLARAKPVTEARSQLRPMVALHGSTPPGKSMTSVSTNCGEAPAEGVVIAFTRRIRVSDMPLEPWRWGRWYVISHLAPAEVVDPQMVEALRQAAGRLETDE